jgi:steroid 5-alpha reductase family enzyme
MLKPLLGITVILLISAGIALAGSQGSISVGPYPLFALCAAVGFLLHWAIFIPSFLFQTEHYFDLTGGISYLCTVGLAFIAYPDMDARGTLLCFMVAIWSARLGTFLFLRVKRAGQDRRFNEIKKKFFRFAFTWTLGGGWVFITMAAALAAITSEQQQPLGILAYLGTLVWLVGFGIEVVADRQKTIFRKDPANAEQFITTGLWSKSRHPNYFGEIVLWFGVALIALPALSGWQLVTLISPLFVTFLLIKVSGVRMLEEGAQKRWGTDPAYQQYLASTPVLVPKLV